jgi:hypothetical protein
MMQNTVENPTFPSSNREIKKWSIANPVKKSSLGLFIYTLRLEE